MEIFHRIISRFCAAPPSLLHWCIAAIGLLFLLGGVLGWRWVWEPRSITSSLSFYLSQRFGKKGRILYTAGFLAACLLLVCSTLQRYGTLRRERDWLLLPLALLFLLQSIFSGKDPKEETPPKDSSLRCLVKKTVYRLFGETGSRIYAGLFGVLIIFLAGAVWFYSA